MQKDQQLVDMVETIISEQMSCHCDLDIEDNDSQLVGALSPATTKDYIRAEHKLHSVSKLFTSQVIIPQVKFFF